MSDIKIDYFFINKHHLCMSTCFDSELPVKRAVIIMMNVLTGRVSVDMSGEHIVQIYESIVK